MAAMGGAAAVQGLARGKLTLTGEGNDWAQLIQTLVGQGQLVLAQGGLPGIDVAEKLVAAIPGGQLAAVAERAGQGTVLRDLQASFQVKDGWLLLTRPLTLDSRFGSASLGGRIGLDQRLDLKGEAKVAPEYVAKLTGGRLTPKSPLPIPMSLGGTLKAPTVGTGTPTSAVDVVEEKVRGRVEEELGSRAQAHPRNGRSESGRAHSKPARSKYGGGAEESRAQAHREPTEVSPARRDSKRGDHRRSQVRPGRPRPSSARAHASPTALALASERGNRWRGEFLFKIADGEQALQLRFRRRKSPGQAISFFQGPRGTRSGLAAAPTTMSADPAEASS